MHHALATLNPLEVAGQGHGQDNQGRANAQGSGAVLGALLRLDAFNILAQRLHEVRLGQGVVLRLVLVVEHDGRHPLQRLLEGVGDLAEEGQVIGT